MANTSNAGRTSIARRSSELLCGEENVQATPETQEQGRRGANVRRTGSRHNACSPSTISRPKCGAAPRSVRGSAKIGGDENWTAVQAVCPGAGEKTERRTLAPLTPLRIPI
jgi:hypothetical protein